MKESGRRRGEVGRFEEIGSRPAHETFPAGEAGRGPFTRTSHGRLQASSD
jgi:hypothetical protein